MFRQLHTFFHPLICTHTPPDMPPVVTTQFQQSKQTQNNTHYFVERWLNGTPFQIIFQKSRTNLDSKKQFAAAPHGCLP
jgi:hypothetical protein